MPRFNGSSGRGSIVSLKQRKRSLAETVNEQLARSAFGGGGAGGAYRDDDEYADGGFAEDYEFDDVDSNGFNGDDDAERGSRRQTAASAAEKPTKDAAKKLPSSASSSRLRHRGPLDASLSEGKYAATPVNERGGRGVASKNDAVGRKRRRAKDLTEKEYTAWLENKSSKQKKAGQLRRSISLGGGNSGVGEAVLDSEEADILRQLSELRQTQMSLVPAGNAASAGTSSAAAETASTQTDAKQTRDVVQHLIMVYGQLLRLRVLLQPAVTKAISMPQYYARSLFVDGDAEVDDAAAAASNGDGAAEVQEMREGVSKHYSELQDDVEQVLATLYAAATGSGRDDRSSNVHVSSSASKPKKAKTEGDLSVPSYREVERYHERVLRHADTCLDYWGRKLVQANSAKLKTIAQPLPQQIAAILSAKSRLRSKLQKNRSHMAIMAHPEHVRAETSADIKAQRALHIAEGDVDDEIYDDADFLRELVRRGGAVASQLEKKVREMQRALLPSREGARKGFHRMTKGKAVNYEPRPKLVAFMVPEPLDNAQRSDVVVKNLFQ
ncbi:Apoptosis antagonizing transcription factor family protein [Leishmania donovani]|uniref:Apoptosis antagonizing transcription factor family protein n=1 Tax=Leishmania donovani TaxID=5661 RepID=A0A504XQV9_LEIDO|nr:Apoptosis antagonizing transcription factor family protein [Leishmania donovani]